MGSERGQAADQLKLPVLQLAAPVAQTLDHVGTPLHDFAKVEPDLTRLKPPYAGAWPETGRPPQQRLSRWRTRARCIALQRLASSMTAVVCPPLSRFVPWRTRHCLPDHGHIKIKLPHTAWPRFTERSAGGKD